jgi:hypothetical protein
MLTNRTSIVLHALVAAANAGEPAVRRTNLVKVVYLAEILRPAYGAWSRMADFVKWKHGPYDREIISRAELLVFNGLARALAYVPDALRTNASYACTPWGVEVSERIRAHRGDMLYNLVYDVQLALQSLGVSSADELCKLVYQDPNFDRMMRSDRREAATLADAPPIPVVTSMGSRTLVRQMVIASEWAARTEEQPTPRQQVYAFIYSLAMSLAAKGEGDGI